MKRRQFMKATAACAAGAVLLEQSLGLAGTTDKNPNPTGGTMAPKKDLPFMYQDISEGKFMQWTLNYTFPLIITLMDRIPREKSWVRPAPNIDPAAWILGSVVNNEDRKLAFLTGQDRVVGKEFDVFQCPANSSSMPPEAEGKVNKYTVDFMLANWVTIRNRTNAYLEKVTSAVLKSAPDRSAFQPENHDPVREEFVMLVYQQNLAFGKLLLIEQLLAGASTKTAFPSFSESSKLVKTKYAKEFVLYPSLF